MKDYVFVITDPDDNWLKCVVISADDINDARRDYPGLNDDEIAVALSEQRYESALAKLGISYEEAVARGLDYREQVIVARRHED
jgi:hypothetical protein